MRKAIVIILMILAIVGSFIGGSVCGVYYTAYAIDNLIDDGYTNVLENVVTNRTYYITTELD